MYNLFRAAKTLRYLSLSRSLTLSLADSLSLSLSLSPPLSSLSAEEEEGAGIQEGVLAGEREWGRGAAGEVRA